MSNTLLCSAVNSLLVVIDIQSRLAGAMATADRERVVKNSGILLQAATKLAIPVIATEQYAKGLGPTDEAVSQHFPAGHTPIDKTCFACSGNQHFMETLSDHHRGQVILTGMETHVCVLQTAMELLHAGYQVFVVADAVCSRSEANYRNALERLRQSGIIVTNTESLLFEWLRDAKNEHFKAITALIK